MKYKCQNWCALYTEALLLKDKLDRVLTYGRQQTPFYYVFYLFILFIVSIVCLYKHQDTIFVKLEEFNQKILKWFFSVKKYTIVIIKYLCL